MDMPKQEFSDFRTFLTLTLICVCTAAILGGVYDLTKKPIADADVREKKEALKVVMPAETAKIETKIASVKGKNVEVDIALDNTGKIIGYAIPTRAMGYGGYIKFLLGVTPNGNIFTYHVMSLNETPGLGDNVTSEKFKKQFVGKNLRNFKFKVTKDGGDVQAITAATISSRAATKALKEGLETFEAYKRD